MYYSCKAVRGGRLGETVSSVVLTSGLILLTLSFAQSPLSRPIFGIALSLLMLGIMLIARYCFTEYTYTLESGIFTVTERRGRRTRVTARLELSEISRVECVKRNKYKRGGGDVKVYDYRPGLWPSEFTVITLTDPRICEGRERILLLISPDQKMLHLLGM